MISYNSKTAEGNSMFGLRLFDDSVILDKKPTYEERVGFVELLIIVYLELIIVFFTSNYIYSVIFN